MKQDVGGAVNNCIIISGIAVCDFKIIILVVCGYAIPTMDVKNFITLIVHRSSINIFVISEQCLYTVEFMQ